MTEEYRISITGGYEIFVLSPEMIAQLINKVKNSDVKEFIIPAEEMVPRGYMEYLMRVLAANMEIKQPDAQMCEVYQLIAKQITKLSVDHQSCFDRVSISGFQYDIQFNFITNLKFYMRIKQETGSCIYVFSDMEQNEIRLILAR